MSYSATGYACSSFQVAASITFSCQSFRFTPNFSFFLVNLLGISFGIMEIPPEHFHTILFAGSVYLPERLEMTEDATELKVLMSFR